MSKNNTYNKTIFQDTIEKEILPSLEEYEEERQVQYIKYRMSLFLEIVCFILMFSPIFIIAFIPRNLVLIGFLILLYAFIACGAVAGWDSHKTRKNFNSSFKQVYGRVLSIIGDIIWINRGGKQNSLYKKSVIDNISLIENNMFKSVYSRCFDDEFTGKYKGTEYKISETDFSYNRYDRFNGALVQFNINKYTEDSIDFYLNDLGTGEKALRTIRTKLFIGGLVQIITSAIGLYYLFNIWHPNYPNPTEYQFNVMCIWASFVFVALVFVVIGIKSFIDLILVKSRRQKTAKNTKNLLVNCSLFQRKYSFSNRDFNRTNTCNVYSFIQKLDNMKTAFRAQNIRCCFYKNTVTFAIYTKKDLFEPIDVRHTLLNADLFNNIYDMFNSIHEMIDLFNSESE